MIADERQPKTETRTAAASNRPAVGPSNAVVASSPILVDAPISDKWQGAEVDQVHEQVEHADQHGAADHPEREIALGAFDFTGAERRLVPAVEGAEDRHDREPHRRDQVARRQWRGPVRCDPGRREQSESNQAGNRQEFDGGQRALDLGPLLRAEVVHRRQHRDG